MITNNSSPTQMLRIMDELWNDSLIGFTLISKSNKFIAVNPEFCRELQYSEVELVGRKLRDFIHPDDFSDLKAMLDKLKSGSQHTFDIRVRYRTKIGKYIWALSRISGVVYRKQIKLFIAQIVEHKSERVVRDFETCKSKPIPTTRPMASWIRYWGIILPVLSAVGVAMAEVFRAYGG